MTGTDERAAHDARTLLVHLGTAMVATGQPINEVEDELSEVGRALGYPDTQIAAGPTGVTLSLASGEPATFEAVTGALRLDQSAQVRGIRRDLLVGRLDAAAAVASLVALRLQPPRYPVWLANLGWIATATGIALILQPGWPNVALAALGSVVVVALVRLAQRLTRAGDAAARRGGVPGRAAWSSRRPTSGWWRARCGRCCRRWRSCCRARCWSRRCPSWRPGT